MAKTVKNNEQLSLNNQEFNLMSKILLMIFRQDLIKGPITFERFSLQDQISKVKDEIFKLKLSTVYPRVYYNESNEIVYGNEAHPRKLLSLFKVILKYKNDLKTFLSFPYLEYMDQDSAGEIYYDSRMVIDTEILGQNLAGMENWIKNNQNIFDNSDH